jgi:RHS repeat-associated protein
VRKVWVHSGIVEERIYLGSYEVYRRRVAGAVEVERQTLHVNDVTGRVLMVETKTIDVNVPAFTPVTRWRFQLSNHLGSASLEVSEAAAVISYEEYHPFGTTAYRSSNGDVEVSAKRYRYTGKERDEETGFGYHGARYLALWLGRWASADPSGLVDGANLFAYVRGNPAGLNDPSGREVPTHSAVFGPSEELQRHVDYRLLPEAARVNVHLVTEIARANPASVLAKEKRLRSGELLNDLITVNLSHFVPVPPGNAESVKRRSGLIADANAPGKAERIAGSLATGAAATILEGGWATFWNVATFGGYSSIEMLLAARAGYSEGRTPAAIAHVAIAGVPGVAPAVQLSEAIGAASNGEIEKAGFHFGSLATQVGIAFAGDAAVAPEEAAMQEVGAQEAGVVANDQHHIFPQEWRKFFEERGFTGSRNIDRYTLELEKPTHQAIHGGGDWRLGRTWEGEWNNQIMSRITKAEAAFERPLEFGEVMKIGGQMTKDYGLNGIKWEPYRKASK